MSEKKNNILECCLFFTANSLARVITKIGEEEFSTVGMTPSYAFLLTLAIEQPGISQKELAANLHMAPSTVSRFVDALVNRGLISKTIEGRNTYIFPTKEGETRKDGIREAWLRLYERYSGILGKEQGDQLTEMAARASKKLSER